MYDRSDEVWESYAALSRRVQRLAERVGELEARLRALGEPQPPRELQAGAERADGFSVTPKSA